MGITVIARNELVTYLAGVRVELVQTQCRIVGADVHFAR